MKRLTIMLPDDMDERLRREARRNGSSIADVARQALESAFPAPAKPAALTFFSLGEGGPRDASERPDEFVAKAIARKASTRAR